MGVDEMKAKLHELVDKEVDEQKLQKAINFLSINTLREISAEEVFEKMFGRYDETLKKLANPNHKIKDKKGLI